MWVSVQTINRITPSATHGWNSAPINPSGELPGSPTWCMPWVSAELPATLLRTVITANRRVLARRSVAGIRGYGCLLALLRDELPAPAAQSHVFPRFFHEPPAVVRVKYHFPDHAPDHARPEI